MPSRIVFLGTGGDASVVGKHERAAGGILVQSDHVQLHLDPGPGALAALARLGINVREHTAILVSHAHTNHASELNALIGAMTHNGLDTKGVLIANETVVHGSPEIPRILTPFHQRCLERVLVAKPGSKFGIEHVEVHAIPAEHDEPHAVGFKIFTPAFTVTYSSDTAFSKELADVYKKSDILILNCVHPGSVKDHLLCSDDVIRILKRARPKLCVITHFGTKMLAADPVQEARRIQQASGIDTVAANDGITINPAAYAALADQKTLGIFTQDGQAIPREAPPGSPQ